MAGQRSGRKGGVRLGEEKQREDLLSVSNSQEGWEEDRLIAATQSLLPCSPGGCMRCLSPRISLLANVADKIPAADSSGSKRK